MNNRRERENDELDAEESGSINVNVLPDDSVWKQIILLHTRVPWENFVIIPTVTFQFQLVLYDISFRGKTASTQHSNDLMTEKLAMDGVYAFDVISAIIYRKWSSLSSTYGQPARPIIYIVIDVISILPLDWFYRLVTNHENLRVSYMLSANDLLRIHRLLTFFNATRNSVGHRRVYIRVLEFLIFLFLITGVAVAVMIQAVDMVNLDLSWLKIIGDRSSDPKSEFQWCIASYYVMMTQISGHGLPEVYPGIYSLAFILIILISLWVLQAFEIAYLTDIILQRDYSRSLFHREMRLVVNYLDDMEASKETRDNVKKYYNYFWKTQGNSTFEIMKFGMYPSIFLKECALELAWDAYKHSHLFRDQPIPFLRDLAVLFDREYYRPGEMIIEKYERKNRLIYVVTGIVQFLSEEDDRSPILSFSGGTILCESTLILSQRSLCNVIACTEVELNVLDHGKFVELMVNKYQNIYRIIQSRIRFRYWKALRMVTIGAALHKNKSHIVSVSACTDVAWLKHTLKVLQNRQNRIVTRKDKKEYNFDAIFASTDFRYTFAYLDMLVISDNIAIMTDQVCLNNGQLPWIFYPNSRVLNYWEGFVLACCLALSLVIPGYVSHPKYQMIEFSFFINIICSIYVIDLIITSSTAVHENDMIHANIINIISRRMYNISYWADIIAALPIDWILLIFGSQNVQLVAYCKLNRLVKIYKFEEFFSSLEDRMVLSSYKVRAMKYTFYMVIVTYFLSACILLVTCPRGDCESSNWLMTFIANSNEDMNGKVVITAFLYASQILVGIGSDLIIPKSVLEFFLTIPLIVIGAAFFNYVTSSVAATQILGAFTKSRLRFMTMSIAWMLDRHKVPKPIQMRVFQYLELQWVDNDAYVLTFERQIFDAMTPKMRKELNAERLASLIKGVDLFHDMEEKCIREICSICKVSLLPPQEIVGYRGNECKMMCIIEKGHCQIWRNIVAEPINVSEGKALYVIEMLYNLKIFHSVSTVTHVSIVQIVLKDLMQVLAQFPMEKATLMRTIKKFKNSDEFAKILAIQDTLPRQNMLKAVEKNWQLADELSKTKTKSKSQGPARTKTSNIGTSKNFSDELSWKQSILMLFLLKSTISPHGRFIRIWEGVRSIGAYILIIVYSFDSVFFQITSAIFSLTAIFALPVMIVIDLYIRLHVQFYNSHRILVTHPLSTAKNYIKTGLIVDIIALFPLEHFFLSPETFKLNKLLMAHRIIGGLRHHYSWPYTPKYMRCVMFLPIIFLTAHIFACGLLLELCEIRADIEESENFAAGIYCSPKNVAIKYKVEEPITPIKMYVYSILYVFATITKIGGVNINPIKYTGVIYVLILTLVSFILLVVVTTFTVATISRRDAALTAYQEQMMILMSYLKENKVSIEFRDEVVDYFEYFWILRRGTSIKQQMKLFPPALREDVLWSVYGPSLTKSPGFSMRNESFFRSLFSHMEVKFYSKGSEIMSVNLVHSLVYFIHWGWAEVFAPDGTKIATLGCGSMFGNFISSSTMRQTCSIVARTHVEAIVIESADFCDVMMRHPNTKKGFISAMTFNTDYMSAGTEAEEVDVVNQTKKKSSSFILLPNTTLVQTWEIFSVLYSSYFAFGLFIYHIAVIKLTDYWLLLPYSIDFTFILKIGLVFFTAYEDDLGDYVLDKTLIARRFRESKLGLYFHIFTIIPFELFSLIVTDDRVRSDVFAWLRVNRAVRLILVVNYFWTACNRLNINISAKRIFYAMVLLFSLFHSTACMMIISEDATDEDTVLLEGIRAYVDHFHTAAAIFTTITPHTVPKNYREALSLVIIFIFFYIGHAVLFGEVCAVVDVNQFIMNEYERRIAFFRERVTRMDLTYILRTNAWSYGSKLWHMRRGQQTPRLISEAPISLQYSVSNEMYAHHLLKNEILGKLHEDFIRQLTFHFKDNLFFPGDRIVNVGDVDETMYFIDKGTVDISASELELGDGNGGSLHTLGPEESFGVVQGLYEKIPHTATYTAKTTTHIIYLYRLHWTYLLEYFPLSTTELYRAATQIIRSNGLEVYI